MARRAKFGSLPRVQPSLTATIVSIAREMLAAQDTTIMDAWKNGGEYQGAQVTDSKVLAYWVGRKANLDKADPLYDQYNNNILQLQYGIEQSKNDLLHIQGKLSDSAYAQFFIGWAKRIPQNSEWWRTLQKDAAQLVESAKAKSAAAAAKAKTDNFNTFVSNTTSSEIGVGNALTEAITALSKETGLTITENGDQLLALLTTDYKNHADKYHVLTDALKVGDPSFSGTFTSAYAAAKIGSAEHGYDAIATRAKKDGFATAYSSATTAQTAMSSWGDNLHVWPVAKSYDVAYNQFMKVWGDATASSMDKRAAAAVLSATVAALTKSPGVDTATKTMLAADATRLLGGDAGDSPSFGVAMLGHTGVTPAMQQEVAVTTAAQTAMDQNPLAFEYASVDKTGAFDPTGQSPLGIVPTASVPSDAVYVMQPGLDGKGIMVAVQPKGIMVQDPSDPTSKPTQIGNVITYSIGGRVTTLYGYSDAKGVFQWTDHSPLADGATTTFDKTGNLVVSPVAKYDPMGQAAAFDAQHGTNLAAQMKPSFGADGKPIPGSKATATAISYDTATGKATGRITVSWDGTSFNATQTSTGYDAVSGKMIDTGTYTIPFSAVTSPTLTTDAIAPSVRTGANLPGTYSSPMAASVATSVNNMATGQIAALVNNPAFQHAFAVQTMSNYGTQDPNDPRVITAWRTLANTGQVFQGGPLRENATPPQARTDLTYPGQPVYTAGQQPVRLSFGTNTIKLPSVPSVLGGFGQAPSIPGAPTWLNGAAPFSVSALQPGQVPGTPATPGVTPTPGPSMGTITPSIATTVAPTPAPSVGVIPGVATSPGPVAGVPRAPAPK